MQRQSESQKQFLREAAQTYHENLLGSLGEDYLTSRGLGFPKLIREDTARFKLGYVSEPLPGHGMFRAHLALPYIRWSQSHGWTVVSIRYRCIEDHKHDGHGKYMTVSGDRPRLYNTLALLKNVDDIYITEGEIDAITAESCGLNAVAVPGATSWKPWFINPFLGYKRVFILVDGDEAGLKFGHSVSKTLPNSRMIPMPDGEDVNSLVTAQGKEALLESIK